MTIEDLTDILSNYHKDRIIEPYEGESSGFVILDQDTFEQLLFINIKDFE